jgi:hypothetical protein
MSKFRRLRQRALKKGDTIFIQYGVDRLGQYWWHCNGEYGGPFCTRSEAEKNSQVTVFGPQCEFTDGGQWDPAWNNPQ